MKGRGNLHCYHVHHKFQTDDLLNYWALSLQEVDTSASAVSEYERTEKVFKIIRVKRTNMDKHLNEFEKMIESGVLFGVPAWIP